MATKTATKPKSAKADRSQKRDERFVDLVAKGVSPTDAYKAAGFTTHAGSASAGANRKLKDDKLASLLEQRKAHFRAIADVDAIHIMGAWQEIAFSSIEDAFDDNGNFDFAKAKETGAIRNIKKISKQHTQNGESISVEFYGRDQALSQLTEILGLKHLNAPKPTFDPLSVIAGMLLSKGLSKEEAANTMKELEFIRQNHEPEQIENAIKLIG